jgi:hypothetical protein
MRGRHYDKRPCRAERAFDRCYGRITADASASGEPSRAAYAVRHAYIDDAASQRQSGDVRYTTAGILRDS